MTYRKLLASMVLVAAAAMFGSEAMAQEKKEKEKDKAMEADQATAAQMEAYAVASAPGPMHERLSSLAGEYEVTVKSWEAPGSEPTVTTGMATLEMAFDGRYLTEKFKGDMFGQAFKGMGLTGYDKVKDKVVSTWIDNMSTGIMMMEGKFDESGKVITTKGEYTDPVTGETGKLKGVTTIESPEKHRYEMFGMAPDGSEFKMMEIVYMKKM